MPAPLSSPSREGIDFFHENSYIQYPAFFTSAEIRTLRAAIDAAIAAKRERIRGAAKGGRHSEEYERVYIPDYVRFTGGSEATGAEMEASGPWDHPLHPILAGR